MGSSVPYVVDRAAVEAEVSRRRAIHEKGYARWFAAKLAMSLVAFYLLAFGIRVTTGPQPLSSMTLWNVSALFVLPALLAFFVTYLAARLMFNPEAFDAERFSARVAREMQLLTGRGWLLRMVLAGLMLAAGVAIPVAIVALLGFPIVVPGSSRAMGAVEFIGATLVWAIAMAFVVRYAALYVYRKLVRRTPA
jgi:hypothetical protein